MRIAPTLLLSLAACNLPAAETRDYCSMLRGVADLAGLPYPEPGVVARQFSSYNRQSRYDRQAKVCVGMDANGDSGHALAVHFGPETASEMREFQLPPDAPRAAFGDLEWVLDPLERNHVFFLPKPGVKEPKTRPPEKIVACIAGPGVIDRIWSANPLGKIRFYFDGRTEPLEFDFQALFEKGTEDPDAATLARRAEWPFIRPMTFRRSGDNDRRAADCYLPIPFGKSCIVALSQPAFYHFGYRTFPQGSKVPTFRLPLTTEEDAALAETCKKLMGRGADPKPAIAGTQTIARTVELAPGKDVVLADLSGPRMIQALHASLQGAERYAHSKVLLEAWFDDEPQPCIWSPLVNFFGTGFGPNDYRSLPLGYLNGEGYCYFPMPFAKKARLVVRNEGRRPARLICRIAHAPAALPPGTMLFKCKYRREEVCRTFDYPFLECRGQGRFVGAALMIDDAWRSWWGEGDEKIWVDGDLFPSFFGTGSEDFFGDAWGIRPLDEAFFACSAQETNKHHARTCCYRWMIPDSVPFRQKFRATIENYPENLWGTKAVDWDEDYVSTAYWYQASGGSDFFQPVAVENRRPWGKVPTPPVVEAEQVLSGELSRGAKRVDDEALEQEFSRGVAIDLGPRKSGDTLTFTGPDLLVEGPYTLQVHTRAGLEGAAAFELLFQGNPIGTSPADFGRSDVAALGAAVLPAGRSTFAIRFTTSGAALFDAFQFVPARQLRDVVEAEKCRVLASCGPAPTTTVDVRFSGGRQLRLPATGPGDTIELEAAVPPGTWDLVVGLVRGPDCGNYEVFVDGRSAGILKGYAPEEKVFDRVKFAVVKPGHRPLRVRFACAGKEPSAKGYGLGLDYVGWQRILVPGALEGETAPLADVRGGRVTDQRLGPRFSGENHLWFHPQREDAGFTWLVDAPKTGSYELAVYFTKSWDYAVVRVSLDGRELGQFDTYAPTVTWGGKTPLGKFELTEGAHRLRFEVAGRNPASKGSLVGIDCITLAPSR